MKSGIPKRETLRIVYSAFLFIGSVAISSMLVSCKDDSKLAPSVTDLIAKEEGSYNDGTKVETLYGTSKKQNGTKVTNESLADLRVKMNKEYSDYQKRFSTSRTIYEGYDIGVIPDAASCPSWSEKINIFMDNEDHNNHSSQGGWTGSWSVTSGGNSSLNLCRVDGRVFGQGHSYTVVSLGNNRPSSFETTSSAYVDNEDNNNQNSSSGDLGPNIVSGNTFLYLYTNALNSEYTPISTFPNLNFAYGVLGDTPLTLFSTYPSGYHSTDDEDNGSFGSNGTNINSLSHVSGTNQVNNVFSGGNLISSTLIGVTNQRNIASGDDANYNYRWKLIKVQF